ncbi:MAG: FtsX-like permease family protein, partial [Myxococcota bacterium]|nr:FtsX-like permease family protein [Myxococcota bacterium]
MRMIKLALRNLFRNRRRTVLTVAAIAVGLSLMLWTVNFQKGSYGTMIRMGISSMAGHVVVQAPGYQEEKEVTAVVEDVAGVASTLASEFPDGVVAPRIAMGGLLMSTSTSVGTLLNGLWPEAEIQVQDLHTKIVEGKWFGDDDREIVIGKAMADTLDVELGDKLVFMGQNGSDEVQSRMFRVRGIYRTGSDQIDGRLAFVHLGAAQELLNYGDVAHMVTLHLDDPDDSYEATDRAETLLSADLDVRNWKEALPELAAMIQMDRASGDVMMAIIGLIVAFGVLNTLLMSVLERTREFGVMLSLGMKPSQLARLVLLEGMTLGLIGALVGLGLGLLFSLQAVYQGIDYAAFAGE